MRNKQKSGSTGATKSSSPSQMLATSRISACYRISYRASSSSEQTFPCSQISCNRSCTVLCLFTSYLNLIFLFVRNCSLITMNRLKLFGPSKGIVYRAKSRGSMLLFAHVTKVISICSESVSSSLSLNCVWSPSGSSFNSAFVPF